MRDSDEVAVGYAAGLEILCPECGEAETDEPIYMDAEFDSQPVCGICGEELEDVQVVPEETEGRNE